MSTNSHIGYETESGTIKHIYCHWDGYPEYMGQKLLDHYNSMDLMKKLVSLGDASIIDKSMDCPDGHTFGNRTRGFSLFYHRDRGEELRNYESEKMSFFNQGIGIQYFYWMDLNGKFHVSDGSEIKLLTKEIVENGFYEEE